MTQLKDVAAPRATRDIAWQLLNRGLNLALGVVVTAVMVHRLGDRDFGQWSTALAVTQLVGYFGALRLEQVAVERAAVEPEHEAQWLGALLSLRLVLCVPVTVIALAVVLIIATNPAMRVSGMILCLGLPMAAVSSARVVFQLRVRNSLNATIESVNGLLWGAAVIAIAIGRGGMVALAIAFSGAAALTTAAQVVLARRELSLRLRDSRARWSALVRVGGMAGLAGLLVLAYGRIDQVLVFELAGDRQAGLYGAVYRILDRVQLLPATVMFTLFPLMAASHGVDPARLRRLVQTAIDYLAVAALPVLAFSIVAAGPLVRVMFGTTFLAAAPALPILMAAFVAICFGYLAGYLVIIVSLQGRLVGWAVAGLVVNVGLNLVFIPRYGFLAAAWTTLATEVLVLVLTARAILPVIGLRPQLGRLTRICAASAAMGAAVWGLRAEGVPLAGLIVAGVGSYAALTLALGALRLGELRKLTGLRPGP